MNKDTKNKISNLDNLSLDVYSDKKFVSSYSDRIEYNSHNALYERPATQSLITDVRGKQVLDAGCGPGNYSLWLAGNGAIVTAVDYSDEMIKLTKEKIPDGTRVLKENLNLPLNFLKDEEFDIILSSMVIHYIKDWRMLFSEFNRILKKEGILIFSTHHPYMDFNNHPDGNYFDTELITDEWPSYEVEMKFYRRPFSDIFDTLKECDFKIDTMLEPRPVEECKVRYPDSYHTLSTQPWFICFRVIKEK